MDFSKLVKFEKLSSAEMKVGGGEKFSDKVSTPLFLEQCHVHVSMKANVFQTTQYLTFSNCTSKVLEGELVFPLPKDSSIHNYGLDVDGVIVDAVPVPKETARVAFETTVRERGPAISVAEKVTSSANVFKTKVYPMPSLGQRTIKLVVIQSGIDDKDSTNKEQLLHYLPISKPAGIKIFSYSIDSVLAENAEVFVRRTNGMMASIEAEEINATTDFEGILLVVKKPASEKSSVNSEEGISFFEKDVDSGYYYFSSTFSNLETMKGKPIKEFKKISVFYDVSTSRKSSQWKQELKLLYLFLEKHEHLNPIIEVSVFSCSIHEKREFKDRTKCVDFLNSQNFDGGTSIPLEEISKADGDLIFLFSDGITNFGKDLESQLFSGINFSKPIFCCSSSSMCSYLILRFLGNQSGGCFFDLSEESVESVVEKIDHEKITLKKITVSPGNAIEEIYKSEIVNNSITIFGRLILPEKEPKIELDFGDKKYFVSLEFSKLKLFEQDESKIIPLLRTLWAQQKINKFSIFPQKNKKLIEELGMKYGIVTEHTSLIVLSEFSQFRKYKIVPPKQLKELRKLYLNEIEKEELDEKTRKQEKLDYVASKWIRRVEWHKRDFRKEVKAEVEHKKLEFKKRMEEEENRRKREEDEKKRMEEIIRENEVLNDTGEEMEELLELNSEMEVLLKDSGKIVENEITSFGIDSDINNYCPPTREKGICESNNKVKDEISDSRDKINEIKGIMEMNMDRIFGNLSRTENLVESAKELELEAESFQFRISNKNNNNNNINDDIYSFDNNMDEMGLVGDMEDITNFDGINVQDIVNQTFNSSPVPTRSTTTSASASESKPEKKRVAVGLGYFDDLGNLGIPNSDLKPSFKPIQNESVIQVKAFKPGEEYLRIISSSKTPYTEYLNQKEKYQDSPSFYLDCSDFFLSQYYENQKNKKNKDLLETGIRILSNVAELELNNVQLFRIIGYRLSQVEKYEEAKFTLERVLKEKPEEPQSFRDLGLVLEKMGNFEKSAELLYHVICMNVDDRFDEIELTSLVELNHVLYYSMKNEEERNLLIRKLEIEDRFLYKFDVDIRISMAWDTDMTDIDLHVYDPDDEHCFFSHNETKAGGFVSRDFVNGYGPEEFMQKSVFRSGKYKITAKYYASHQQSLTGGTTILCSFFTNYMRENEKQDLITLRLTKNKEEIEVCEISFNVSKENEIFTKEIFDSIPKIVPTGDMLKYQNELNHLKDMGFTSVSLNLDLLKRYNGNMEQVLASLMPEF